MKISDNSAIVMSRQICVTDENAVLMSDVYCIAKISPVLICKIKHTSKRKSKFHHAEMLDGVGRSVNDWLIIFFNG
jgi:hypothetical protein